MSNSEGAAEYLQRVSKIGSRKEKIDVLRNEFKEAVASLVDACFNENIVFLLPDTDPPFKPQPKEADLQDVLLTNAYKLRVFINHPEYAQLRQLKRETLFIEFLESMDPDDAKLLLAVKNRKLPYKGLTRKLFEEAYPALAAGWTKVETAEA